MNLVSISSYKGLKNLYRSKTKGRRVNLVNMKENPGSKELVKYYRYYCFLVTDYHLLSYLECLNIHTVIFVILYDNLVK